MLERSDVAAEPLQARLAREGLRPSDFVIVEGRSSLRGAVEACREARDRRLMPIIVLREDAVEDEKPISAGDIQLDPARCLLNVRGREWLLRAKPVAVLRALMERPGRVIPRDVLIRKVWGSDRRGAGGALRVYIHDLRRMIEPDRSRPRHIVTVRGETIGYVFQA